MLYQFLQQSLLKSLKERRDYKMLYRYTEKRTLNDLFNLQWVLLSNNAVTELHISNMDKAEPTCVYHKTNQLTSDNAAHRCNSE